MRKWFDLYEWVIKLDFVNIYDKVKIESYLDPISII